MGAPGSQEAPRAARRTAATAAAAPAGAAAAEASPGLLLSIPAAVLHEVSNGKQRVLDQGTLTVSLVDRPVTPVPRAPRPAPAPPSLSPLGAGLALGEGPSVAAAGAGTVNVVYPEIYRPPSTASDAGSEGSGGQEGAAAAAVVFAVGSTAWEVLPASQTLKVGELTYVMTTDDPDTRITDSSGVFFTVTLAADTQAEAVGMLEAILENLSIYRESEKALSSREAAAGEAAIAGRCYRSSLARGVHAASRTLAGWLLASATFATGTISKGAERLRPAQATTQPVVISPGLKKRLSQTARLAHFAARAVNSAVSGLAWAGAKVAGGVLWLAGADKPLKPGEEAGVLREVSQAALLGFTEVWDGMEQAGLLVLLSARDNTADAVRQRYGEDASQASISAMNAAGSSAEAVYAVRKISVKTVAKAAAKKTATGVIHRWAGADQPGGASSTSLASKGGSKGGSADDLAASAGPATPGATPAGKAAM